MNKSIWSLIRKPFEFESLKEDIVCDTLVVGGGMAGVLCAHYLQERGVDVVLVEGRTIGSGITQNTTAVVSAQHDVLYSKLIARHGKENAKRYLEANLWAVEQFYDLSQRYDFDFERKPSIVYSQTESLTEEIEALKSLGFDARLLTEVELPVGIKSAVKFPGMAQIHPLKLLYALASSLKAYEKTYITKIKKGTAYTERNKITAKRIIVTTHYPFINSHGFYFSKLYQMRSYILAYKNAQSIEATYVDLGEGGLYFRSYGDYLLVGGNDHRTGTKSDGYTKVRDFMRRSYPSAVEEYSWATQDCMSLDGMPYIGQYSKRLPNVYVASGFNAWDMTSAIIAAGLLSDRITGKNNSFAKAFTPNRKCLRPKLFINIFVALATFFRPTAKRCSHLGCALCYNKNENTWDCVCHGSRFSESGKLIDNPAMRDVKL